MKKTFRIYTHGCKVNQYESEAIREAFRKEGFEETSLSPDVAVINTCTVTKEATATCRQTINKVLRESPNAAVLVCGCFSQILPNDVSSLGNVDYICGSADKMSVVREAVELIKNGKRESAKISVPEKPESLGFEKTEISAFPRTRAYVKIEDGCNNRCAYCIIPTARGRVRSKLPEDVINEVNLLTENGVPEIVLTGIETDAYGLDFESYRLQDLIEDISEKTNVSRIRLGSTDPFTFTEDFVRRVCTKEIMLPHYHVSMQSGCSKTLREMRRRVNGKQAHDALERIRKAVPGVMFSADFIVGFPGETEEDFKETLEFIKEERFLHLHVFKYSIREGTEAASRKDQIPGEIKSARSRTLIETQAKIKKEILSANVGKTFPLLVETVERSEGCFIACGHTPSFMEVTVKCNIPPKKGDIIEVTACGENGDSLLAEYSI